MALGALIDFQQSATAERRIDFIHRNRQPFRHIEVEPIFILVEDQLVCRNPHGQDVVGDPLVQQITLVRPLRVNTGAIAFGAQTVVRNPLLQFRQQVGVGGLQALLTPELVPLGKDGESNLAVLGRIGYVSLAETMVRHSLKVFYLASFVHHLVHLVATNTQRVEQSTGLYGASHYQIPFLLAVDDGRQIVGCRSLAGQLSPSPSDGPSSWKPLCCDFAH